MAVSPIQGKAAAPPTPTFNPNLEIANSAGPAEPSIRTDDTGTSFVIGPTGFPTGGCKAFTVSPNGSSSHLLGFPDHNVGGGDCDWAVGPDETGSSRDVLGYSSLLLSSIVTGNSTDGGKTFSAPNPYGQSVPLDDRMWNAADPRLNAAGQDDMFMTYHDLNTDEIEQDTSINGGQTYSGNPNQVINPSDVPVGQWTSSCPGAGCVVGGPSVFAGNNLGNIVSRRGPGGALTLYSIFTTPDNATDNGVPNPSTTVNEQNRVYAAVAHVTDTPGTLTPEQPITWHDYEIWHGPLRTVYSQIFPVIAVDGGGRVYAAFGDLHHIYVKSTTDPTKWGCPAGSTPPAGNNPCTIAPTTVDTVANGYPSANNVAVMPWMAACAQCAGDTGGADLVWYGGHGGAAGNNNDPNTIWNVYMAQTVDGGRTWTVAQASDHSNHKGSLCTQGDACGTGSRTLLDFFQVAVDPTDGAATIAYADDHKSHGTPELYFTRQCTGDSVSTLRALTNTCVAPPPPPFIPFGSTCPGPQILDPTNDAPNSFPGGSGQNMDNLDIANASFSTTLSSSGNPTQLVITMKIKNLDVPPDPTFDPNLDGAYWSVHWKYNGHNYEAQANGGPSSTSTVKYVAGADTGNEASAAAGDTAITGQFNAGANGTIVFFVPVGLVGNPPKGADLTNTLASTHGSAVPPAVAGGVYYTAAADSAPNGVNPANPGFGADYFVGQTCLSVSVGYVDNLHLGPTGTFTGPFAPSPWQGSTATTFVGCNKNTSGHVCTDTSLLSGKACPNISGSVPQECYDAGAIRFDNSSATAVVLSKVSVTIGGCTFSPWSGEPKGTLTVPAHGHLILTQTGGLEPNTGCGFGPDPQTPYNFDTSDASPGGACTATGFVPLVSVTSSFGTFVSRDTQKVLNHGGLDPTCTTKNANERTNWSAQLIQIPG